MTTSDSPSINILLGTAKRLREEAERIDEQAKRLRAELADLEASAEGNRDTATHMEASAGILETRVQAMQGKNFMKSVCDLIETIQNEPRVRG